MRDNIEASTLRQILQYNPITGELHWLPRPITLFESTKYSAERSAAIWNSRYQNSEAFTHIRPDGYRDGTIFGRPYLSHRVVWAIVTGAWPTHHLDHVDGNRSNNRLVNLREATYSENSRNVSSAEGSSSRYLGVSWSKRRRCWIAQIMIDGKNTNLGGFASETDAAYAYDRAAKQNFGDFAKLNFPLVLEVG